MTGAIEDESFRSDSVGRMYIKYMRTLGVMADRGSVRDKV